MDKVSRNLKLKELFGDVNIADLIKILKVIWICSQRHTREYQVQCVACEIKKSRTCSHLISQGSNKTLPRPFLITKALIAGAKLSDWG